MKKYFLNAIVLMLLFLMPFFIFVNYRALFVPDELVLQAFEMTVSSQGDVLAGVAAWYYGSQYVLELFCVVSFAVIVCSVMAVVVRAHDSKKILLSADLMMGLGVFGLAVLTIAEKSDLVLKPVLKLFLIITGFSGDGTKNVQNVRESLDFFGGYLPVLILVSGMLILSFVISVRRKEDEGTALRLMPVFLAITVMAGVQWLLKLLCMGNLIFFQPPAENGFGSANAAVDESRCLFILPVILMAATGVVVFWLKEKKRNMNFRGVALCAVSCVVVLTFAARVFLYIYGRRRVVNGVFFYKTPANEMIASMIWGMGLFNVFCVCFVTRMLFHKLSAVRGIVCVLAVLAGSVLLCLVWQGHSRYGHLTGSLCCVTVAAVFVLDAVADYVQKRFRDGKG